jgi:pyruvate/2-oxoglutarate dehydrogenase complex dihydrolipoamide dehydrogenase (E3) component
MYDLVVIGSGAAGRKVATAAAKVGAKVALIEKGRVGGEGTLEACVPSKGLTQAARLAASIRGADKLGLRCGPLQIDFPAVLSQVRSITADLAARDSDEAMRQQGIDVYHGSAAFEAYDTIKVDGGASVVGQRFVIATGSRPAVPEIPGLVEAGVLDDHTVFSLTRLPEHLIVLGADTVGLEFAQSFARLGSTVTVLSDATRILSLHEPEAADVAAQSLAADGVTIKLGVEVTKVETRDGRKVCKYQEKASGAAGEVAGTDILVASGRLANVEGMNLDAVGVHADPQHGVQVDECLQTDSTRVFAIGDVLLRHPFTHVAEREAEVVFQNAVLRLRKKIDYERVPWAAFVDPEVASVGLIEPQAREQQRAYRVFRVPFDDIDRARIEGRTVGFAQVVATPGGKILGATVVGQDASMIIQEFVLAMEKNMGLRDLGSAVPIYPSYAEVAHKLGNQYRASRLESGYVQTALKLFYGFVPRVSLRNGQPATPEEPAPAEDASAAPGHGH